MDEVKSKICIACEKEKAITSFKLYKGLYRANKCYSCQFSVRKLRNPEFFKEKDRKYAAKIRAEKPYKIILKDTKGSDRRKGLGDNDLNEEFVEKLVKQGCLYCGENKILITLDRMDNLKPHNQDNVNPCCIRCNLLKRDMPYEAWKSFIPVVRKVREENLFGDWLSKPIRKK